MKKIKFDNKFARRVAVVTMAYILFMSVVWSTIARQFPGGISPDWLLWLIIGLSIGLYFVTIIVVEWLNLRKG